MALKPDVDLHQIDDISYFMNEVAVRGGIVSLNTAGSGVSLDQAVNLVTYAADSSGQTPLGVLMGDMVNIDQTRQHLNFHKNEVQQGGKVTVGRKGWVVTDQVTGTPTAGGSAFLAPSGRLTTADTSDSNPLVGQFLTTLDELGFVKVYIDLP